MTLINRMKDIRQTWKQSDKRDNVRAFALACRTLSEIALSGNEAKITRKIEEAEKAVSSLTTK